MREHSKGYSKLLDDPEFRKAYQHETKMKRIWTGRDKGKKWVEF